MKNTEGAFKWIIGILQERHIPFQITGGFAARVYGASRELADIDLDVPLERFDEIIPLVKKYALFGPGQFKDENWNLWMTTLEYEGQEIDICAAETEEIFNQNTKQWGKMNVDISKAEQHEVFGVAVHVVSREILIAYKNKLLRDVDKEDVAFLTHKEFAHS